MNMRHIQSATSMSESGRGHETTGHPSKAGGKQKHVEKGGEECCKYLWEDIRYNR